MDFLNTNLNSPEIREAIAYKTGKWVSGVVNSAPTRALRLYTGVGLAATLWLLPLNRNAPKPVLLAGTIGALGICLKISAELEDLQNDIEEDTARQRNQRLVQFRASQTLMGDSIYADVTKQRLAIAESLPERFLPTDLRVNEPAKALSKQAEYEQFLGNHEGVNSASSVGAAVATPSDGNQGTDLSNGYAGLPVVDVAQLMADSDRSVMGSASTGCGKSTLIANAVVAQHKRDDTSDFLAFIHKTPNKALGEKDFIGGVEDTDDFVSFTATMQGKELQKCAEKFEERVDLLTHQIEAGCLVPFVLVIDQPNQGKKACQRALAEAKIRRKNYNASCDVASDKDNSEIEFSDLEEKYSNAIASGVVDGRVKKVKVWSFSHENTNEGMGVAHQIKKNASFLGLGRLDNFTGLDSLLSDNRFIPSKKERTEIQAQLEIFKARYKADGMPKNVVVCLTNLGAERFRLCVLPEYDPNAKAQLNPYTNPPLEKPPLADSSLKDPSLERLSKIEEFERLFNSPIDFTDDFTDDDTDDDTDDGQGYDDVFPTGDHDQMVLAAIVNKLSDMQRGTECNIRAFLKNSDRLSKQLKVNQQEILDYLSEIEKDSRNFITISTDEKMFTYNGGIF